MPDTGEAACCYDTVVCESRIADYIGIAQGQIPGKAYYGRYRSFPDTCDAAWTETQADRRDPTYFGVRRLRGRAAVRGHEGRPVLGRQHVRGADAGAVRARGALGAEELGGEPPADGARADPPRPARGRLRLLGLLARPTSRRAATASTASTASAPTPAATRRNNDARIDHGWEGCPDRPAQPDPPQSAYTNGVVTPHAAFLALRYAPRETLDNLRRLHARLPRRSTASGASSDSVNVDTRQRSRRPTCRWTRG